MIVTYEVLADEALPILEQLERLRLLRKIGESTTENSPISKQGQSAKKKTPLRKKSLAGTISVQRLEEVEKHIQQIREEF